MTNKEIELYLLLQGWTYAPETEDNFAEFTRNSNEKITIFINTMNTANVNAPDITRYIKESSTGHIIKKKRFSTTTKCCNWLQRKNI